MGAGAMVLVACIQNYVVLFVDLHAGHRVVRCFASRSISVGFAGGVVPSYWPDFDWVSSGTVQASLCGWRLAAKPYNQE